MYNVIVKLPQEEELRQAQITTVNRKIQHIELTLEDVVDMYYEYERSGYDVIVSYKTPENDDETDPFTIANELTSNGLEYTATLKTKNKGTYDEARAIARAVESHGYDFDAAITLRIKDDSSVNFDKETSWFSPDDAFYTIKPKAKANDINELRSLYDTLAELTDVSIDVKPKANKDVESDDFATQIAAYPDGTEIVFSLKDSVY